MGKRELRRTITLRLKPSLRMKVAKKAREAGTTSSELIRSILERSLNEVDDEEESPTLFELTRNHVGSVSSARVAPGRDARRALAKWSPDRRG